MEEKDPVLERNFIIFMVLTMAVIFGWMYLFGNKIPKNQPGQKPGTTQTSPGGQTPTPPAPGAGQTAAPTNPVAQPGQTAQPSPVLSPGQPLASAPQFEVQTVEVNSKLYRAVFSSRGAMPVSWKLLKYKDHVYFPYEINLKWPAFTRIPKFTPQPVDLVSASPDKAPLRTTILINNFPVPADAVWKVETNKIEVAEGPTTLTFSLPLPQGIVLKKVYTFYPDKYPVDLKISYEGGEADPKISNVNFGFSYVFEPLNRLARINFHGPLVHNDKLRQTPLKDLDKGNENKQDGVDWAGFTDSYFLTALIAPPPPAPNKNADVAKAGPEGSFTTRAYYSGSPAALQDKNSDKEYSLDVTYAPNARNISDHQLANLQVFFGPKEKDLLQSIRGSLALAIDYGIWAPIAIPMMYALKYVDLVVKNYGWSIIILTIILRMAMFPLTRKSQQSMKEMQKLQPEMQKIRDKYPNDKMKQQEEIYALQRKYKINPLGGCLPMVVQIPIFFAFYKVLVVSIELRHAPWIGWITDLSSRDPLLILPVLMGASQFAMQKLTPTAGADPAQAKMLQFMPIFFTFLMIYFPSGLLLYWTVSNIIGIGQQIYVNRVSQ